MLKARHLSKRIDGKPVLTEVGFELEAGKVAGLIGRNGAGKTTLLKIMSGILDPDGGEVLFEDRSIHREPEAKRELVFIPDTPEAWYGYTGWGAAYMFGQIYPRFDPVYFKDTMNRFGLPLDRNIRHFSKGMRMMFSTALGLSTRARLVLLDEPTNGIDPIAKKQVLTLLMEAAADGMSLVVSSHLLEELERMTDAIWILRSGTVETHASESAAEGIVSKLQVVFQGDAPAAWLNSADVRVLDHIGRVYTLLLNVASGSTAAAELESMNPLLVEPLPVRLEDLYVWKLGGETYAN
ncbi:ABC-2 type transport system ATP-binding protein [Cohnella sp. OV330]|uniref:ABC transporter ATP-binding protein n=1 Tax=Cohnella sp. OV330 TaxID=1855288 RepID=UPI0008F434ED|nr:ABC transporter ATP-binding protein [Cohnella sp. OV330]SFB52848.1 ABC-2 type transport system ATP-binding protein [Cohnella sp. OV330]